MTAFFVLILKNQVLPLFPMKCLLFFYLFMTFCSADIAVADRAIEDYEERAERWERSVIATDEGELRERLIKEKPDSRKVSQIVSREISAEINEPVAMRSIAWLYKNDPVFLLEENETSPGKVIRSSLNRYHYKYPGAGQLCVAMAQSFSPQDMGFLEKVAEKSPNKEDRGLSALAISMALSTLGDEPELLAKCLEHLKKAIQLLPSDTLVEGRKVTDIINDQVYVILHLTKGRVAPSFSGLDLGGKAVSWNSDTGKVAALVFWSYKDRIDTLLPFLDDLNKLLNDLGGEMVSVYTGDSATLRELLAEKKITWQNAFDEDQSITQQYRISQTPTIFVLSKKGEIQSIGEPNALINLTIRALANTSE